MKAGGIGVVRMAVPWSSVQEKNKKGVYNWAGLDEGVGIAARAGLRVLPFLYGTPHWLAAKPTTLPIDNARQRSEWKAFLTAAVRALRPGRGILGQARSERRRRRSLRSLRTGDPQAAPIRRPLPIRTWQIWNEANFFYFAYPASPSRYATPARRLEQGDQSRRPGRQGDPLRPLRETDRRRTRRGCPPPNSSKQLYRCPGIASRFDGIALHPYAIDTETSKNTSRNSTT